jgi:hypothetical protein
LKSRGGGGLTGGSGETVPYFSYTGTEVHMTAHTSKNSKPHNGSPHSQEPNNTLVQLLSKSEEFWRPYRSFAKAILASQRDALAYLDANRRLFDEIRDILRKEQDLALEISQKSLDRAAKSGWAEGDAVVDPSEVSAMFEVATSGWQELGELWMHAHMRSLETIRSYTAQGAKSAAAVRRSAAAAAT